MSVQNVPFARLARSGNAEFTSINEQFSDKRNAANGTLWTDTN